MTPLERNQKLQMIDLKILIKRVLRKMGIKSNTMLFKGHDFKYPHIGSFYGGHKEIFKENAYYFKSKKNNPLIIDAGTHMGLTLVYFKYMYPNCKIIGIEPDINLFNMCKENTKHLSNVTMINSALYNRRGHINYYTNEARTNTGTGSIVSNDSCRKEKITCVRLNDIVNTDIDMLKLDIEGAEYDVIKDLANFNHKIKNIIFEYSVDNTLHHVLAILDGLDMNYNVTKWINIDDYYMIRGTKHDTTGKKSTCQ